MVKIIKILLILSIAIISQDFSYGEEERIFKQNIDPKLFNLITTYSQDLDLNKIKYYLEKGANPSYFPDVNNEGRNTTLSMYVFVSAHKIGNGVIAEEEGNEILKLFFDKGAQIRPTDYRLLATSIDKLNLYLKTLLDNGLDPNKIVEGKTQIERAIQAHNYEAVEILKQYGVVTPSEKERLGLLFFQAVFDDDIDSMKNYLERGVHINDRNRNGQTVLIYALRYCFFTDKETKAILFLLENGVDVNLAAQTDIYGLDKAPPLHAAISQSALFISKENEIKNPAVMDSPKNAKKILNVLIKNGAYVSGLAFNGKTPLHIAAERNNLYAAKLLIKAGAKISPRDIKEKTPLDYAESAKMIKLLKNSGAKETLP